MTIEMLKKYTHLISEISLIREEIESAYNPVTSPNGHEVIGAPGSHDGDPTARAAALVIQLKEALIANYTEMLDLRIQIEKWITTIHDPEISHIVRQHYIIGPTLTGPRHRAWTWADTCEAVYGYRDNRHARRKVTDYLKREQEVKDELDTDEEVSADA